MVIIMLTIIIIRLSFSSEDVLQKLTKALITRLYDYHNISISVYGVEPKVTYVSARFILTDPWLMITLAFTFTCHDPRIIMVCQVVCCYCLLLNNDSTNSKFTSLSILVLKRLLK